MWWKNPTLGRRRVLQLMAAGAAAALCPRLLLRSAAAGSHPLPPYGFLSAEELAILDAAASVIFPTDELPGAREIGVVDYIQSLLSFVPGADANCDRYITVADLNAVEHKALGQFLGCPHGGDVNGDDVVDAADVRAAEAAAFRARPMFAGGPFSGRNPQPHFPVGNTPCSTCHGANGGDVGRTASPEQTDLYPPNAFRQFLPMNRLQRLSWKLRLLGPESVPEMANNPLLATIPENDLRRRYREGLASLESISRQRFGKSYVEVTPAEQQQVLQQADPRFVDQLSRHVIQGIFCAPEYGGNQNRLGWQVTGFDGDSQPLGYEIYDESVPGFYRERPDKPNSGPNPDEDCSGFSPEMERFLAAISSATGGRPFNDPYCFEVNG
jgi:hypothetical protein